MSEQTVIERMVTKYINTLNHQPEDCRDATLAMLAAVRELRDLLDHQGGNPSLLPDTNAAQAYDASNVIERIILEHERRAGGKGE